VRVHTYVITTDVGSAPNYDPPFVSLAVCKPRIRRKAVVGELVLAFAGRPVNPVAPHTVVWAGIVTATMTFADYWQDRRFAGKKPDRSARPDNFYRPVDGGLVWVDNPTHGPEAAQTDTGGLYVLVFDPAWRFGAHGPMIPEEFGLRMIGARRGEHLVDLSAKGWHRLEAWLNAQSQISGPPTGPKKPCRT